MRVSKRSSAQAERVWKNLQEELQKLGIFFRTVGTEARIRSAAEVIALLSQTDLIFAEQNVIDSPACLFFSENQTMVDDEERLTFHCSNQTDVPACAAAIGLWHARCRAATPVSGAVLIGGKSSRMGRPKHLIEDESGVTWLERTIETIGGVTADLAVSGTGAVPDSLKNVPRIEDIAKVEGPLAGIAALFSSRPFNSWLVAACDMPYLSEVALEWILERRHRDCYAVIPVNPRTGRSEPLLAWYDYRCGSVIDELIRAGSRRVSALCNHDRILQPSIPDELADCWKNINYLEEIKPG